MLSHWGGDGGAPTVISCSDESSVSGEVAVEGLGVCGTEGVGLCGCGAEVARTVVILPAGAHIKCLRPQVRRVKR